MSDSFKRLCWTHVALSCGPGIEIRATLISPAGRSAEVGLFAEQFAEGSQGFKVVTQDVEGH